MPFLVDFRFSSAAILDFEKWRFWHFRCLGGVKTKLHAKFGENRMNGSGVIQVFVNFKMAAGGHLVFQISRFPIVCMPFVGATMMLYVKFDENRTSGSGFIQVCVNFKMAAGGHLVFQISQFPVVALLRARQ